MARYLGIFLSREAHDALVRDFLPVHANVRASHITLAFDVTDEQIAAVELGAPVEFAVLGHVADERGQALIVELPAHLRPTDGRVPHVTVSTAPGVSAVYSNQLLRRPTVQLTERRTYVGTLDVGTSGTVHPLG